MNGGGGPRRGNCLVNMLSCVFCHNSKKSRWEKKDTVNGRANCKYQGHDRDQLITNQNLLGDYGMPKQGAGAAREVDSSPLEGEREWGRGGGGRGGRGTARQSSTPNATASTPWDLIQLLFLVQQGWALLSNLLPGVLKHRCPVEPTMRDTPGPRLTWPEGPEGRAGRSALSAWHLNHCFTAHSCKAGLSRKPTPRGGAGGGEKEQRFAGTAGKS